MNYISSGRKEGKTFQINMGSQREVNIAFWNGVPVYLNKYLVEKKQIRVLKRKKHNTRWTKKYRKKYTIQVPMRKIFLSKRPPMVTCHPEILPILKDLF